MAADDGNNSSRTNGHTKPDAPLDRYEKAATLSDNRQRRLEEIEHTQVCVKDVQLVCRSLIVRVTSKATVTVSTLLGVMVQCVLYVPNLYR